MNLAQEVFFRNVVGIVDEMITADRHGVGLEPTLQNQPARQSIHVVHANHDCGKTLREARDASFEFQHILDPLARQGSFAKAQISQIADGRRSARIAALNTSSMSESVVPAGASRRSSVILRCCVRDSVSNPPACSSRKTRCVASS